MPKRTNYVHLIRALFDWFIVSNAAARDAGNPLVFAAAAIFNAQHSVPHVIVQRDEWKKHFS